MNIDFSGLLKLYKELSGSKFCYIFRTQDDGKIVSSSEQLSPEITEITNDFYDDLIANAERQYVGRAIKTESVTPCFEKISFSSKEYKTWEES